MKARTIARVIIVLVVLAVWIAMLRSTAQKPLPEDKELAPDEFAPGEVLVKFKPAVKVGLEERKTSSDELNAILAEYGVLSIEKVFNVEKPANGETYVDLRGQTKPLPDLSHTYRLRFKDNPDLRPLLKRLNADRQVIYAEPNYRRRAYQTPTATTFPGVIPNDPYYGTSGSWGQPYQDMYGLYRIQAGPAWSITQGSASTIIAVIDTGVDLNHPDIMGNLVAGYDFVNRDATPMDDHGHGTHCAGTIAARTNNGIGIAGICWDCKIMPLKGLDAEGSGYDNDLAEAVRWAADHGAKVTSNSWGGTSVSQTLEDAFAYALGRGVINLAAAGNSGSPSPHYPAALESVIAVAATDYQDQLASFSNYGPWIHVTAPGVGILSLRAAGTDMYGDGRHIVGGQYYWASGTSMACPHAAGVIGLIASAHPTWTPANLYATLIYSADDLGAPGRDDRFGFGRINAYRALQFTTPPNTPTPTPTPVCIVQSPHPYPNNYDNTWTLTNPDTLASATHVHFFRIDIESGWDFIYIMDGSGTVYERLSGSYTNYWSAAIPGRTVRIRFTTDSSVVNWGFCVDEVASSAPITPSPTPEVDIYEPDNTCAQARPIIVNGAPQRHNFHVPSDVDWVSFPANAGQVYEIRTLNLGPNADTILELYDRDCTRLLASNDDCDGLESCIAWAAPVSGIYFVRVLPYSPSRTGPGSNYDLYVGATTPITITPSPSPSPTLTPEPGCYTYQVVPINWIDISLTGTAVARGDDVFQRVPLGFAFPFCDTEYSEAYVCSNGFVSFGEGYTHFVNTAIPSPAPPNNAIYAFWDDLFPAGGADGTVYAQQIDADRYVIQWQAVRHFGASDLETFEIVLNRSNRSILIQYLIVANASSITVGVEDADGRSGTQYCFDTPGCVTNGLALLFTPRERPRPVVTPNAFSVSLTQGQTASRQMAIGNQGEAELIFSLSDVETSSPESTQHLEIAPIEPPNANEARNAVNGSGARKAKVVYRGQRTDLNILVYTDDSSTFPGQTAVEQALQRMGISYVGYYGDPDGFAAALPSRAWDAVLVSHNNYYSLGQHWPAMEDYFNRGGRLVIETFDMDGSHSARTTLWNTLGVAYVADVSSDTAMYRWQAGHEVFNAPHSVPNLTSPTSEYLDRGDRANGAGATTAIGGFTPSDMPGQGDVFVRADRRAIVDSFIISEHRGDLDSDGVSDAVELWQNEINYILRMGSGDAPWLTYTPISGTVAVGGRADVTLNFDASELAVGTYTANLLVAHNGGRPNPIIVPVTMSVLPPETACIWIEPLTKTVHVDEVFSLSVQLATGREGVSAVEVYLNFDPAILEALDVVPGPELPEVLLRRIDNAGGLIDYHAGTLGRLPLGISQVATLRLRAKAQTPSSLMRFSVLPPRQTEAFVEGRGVLEGCVRNGTITVQPGVPLVGHVALQGRPTPPSTRWVIPLNVIVAGNTYNLTTDTNGDFQIASIAPGTYDIRVKGSHTLRNLKQGVVLNETTGTVNFGLLLEGDADDSDCVNSTDFSILRTTYGKRAGDPDYDGRADFNGDSIVSAADFSLLRSNYGRCGPVLVSAEADATTGTLVVGAVDLSIRPITSNVEISQIFSVTIRAEAGEQQVDAADIFLNYDPLYLQVVDDQGKLASSIVPGSALPNVLRNTVNIELGRIDYSAGVLQGDAPSGTFAIATIWLKALARPEGGLTQVPFASTPARRTDVLFAGQSVLGDMRDGYVNISIPVQPSPTPLITPMPTGTPTAPYPAPSLPYYLPILRK